MKRLILFFITLLLCNSAFSETDLASSKISDNGHFQVSYISTMQPIEINNLHAWKIFIKNKDGKDIPNAEIHVVGGMPDHNHGLPTQPQITKSFGDGCYLLEGMKFQMPGWWTVTLTITNEDITDTVTFNLKL